MKSSLNSGAAPAAPVNPEIAAWNAEVDRKKFEKLDRKMKAGHDAMRKQLAKARQR